MTTRPPPIRRLLVVVGDDTELRDRVVRIVAARLPARLAAYRAELCTCPMSVRANATHSRACPCSADAA
jgi:hypothetical protein